MNSLYEALEICLQDIEKGRDLESVLLRYPDLADELRPILLVSAGAKSMAAPVPAPEVIRRNRAKVLQHTTQMRESSVRSSQRLWFVSLRRIAVTLVVVIVLFVGGTSLVSASSNTLPGDNLYPVKRTWEDVRLFFTFNPLEREALEVERETERLYETKALLEEGRSEEVDFNGQVISQNGNEWVVEGIRVLISSQTEIRDQGIAVGDAVRVRGVTQGNNTILAERVRLLSDDAKLPEDRHESENGNEDNSGPGSGDEGPRIEETLEQDNSGPGSDTDTNESDNGNSGSDNDNGGSGNSGSGNDHGSDDSQNDNSGDGDNSGSGSDSGGED